jgi:hypothetical protein
VEYSLVNYIYGWFGYLKNRLSDAAQAQPGSGNGTWSREILSDLGAALAGLRVGNQGLKRESQAALQRVMQDVDVMISFAQLADGAETGDERQSYLQEAREYLLSAQENYRVFTRMVAQLAEQPDPFLFRDGFTFFNSGSEVWQSSGFYQGTAALGELALFAEAGWLTLLKPPFLGRTLFSFRAKLDLFEPSEQYLEVTLGELKKVRYQLLVGLKEARLVRRFAGGKEENLAQAPITWGRWRLFQVERDKKDLRILWDGRELMSAQVQAGELALTPEFNIELVKYSSGWWLDDVEVARLP